MGKALNALSLDDGTRKNLLADVLKEAPALTPSQADKLMTRCFRRKVNTLRCLGQAVLLKILDEVVPGAARAAADAIDAMPSAPARSGKKRPSDGQSVEAPEVSANVEDASAGAAPEASGTPADGDEILPEESAPDRKRLCVGP